jgi:hypothetical protein
VYSSTRKWRKISHVRQSSLRKWTEQGIPTFYGTRKLIIMFKIATPWDTHKHGHSTPSYFILFNGNPLQYYTPIFYSGIQNSIYNFRSSNTCLYQFRSLHIHATCPACHILDLSPQCYLVQNQRMKLLIIQFCPVLFEKWEFLLHLLPTNRYHEWRFIAVLLSLFKQMLP